MWKEYAFAPAPAQKYELSHTQMTICPKDSVFEVSLYWVQVLK